ncbi:PREDICTED: uncharacterized protein LOC106750688 [Dinoponera quadriceps]|uniref:SH2 domain-containing adapter protein D n=1 Tax=Dinoponera quadriceps TaxID=609295 RepID=A0A6P3Y6N4_DINQU|nr:PREDICTED: uncharacterized protein LOC106750688 [Dinoponera quadriceps]
MSSYEAPSHLQPLVIHTDHSSGVAVSTEILHLCLTSTLCYPVGESCPAHLSPPAQVSLCDDYSLPVDFVNKRRPASAAAATSTVQWTLPSPTVENAEVEVVEQYSDPRDSKSKAYVEPGAESSLPTIYSRANRNYCRPYTDPSASGSSCEDDEEGRLVSIRKRKNSLYASSSTRVPSADRDTLTSTDGLLVDCVALVHLTDQSPTESNQPVRHPSPYYYGDLFKVPEQLPARSQPSKYRKSVSLDVPGERSRTPGIPKRNSVAGDGGSYSSQQRHYQQQQQPPPPPPHYQSQDLVSPTSGSEHAVPARSEILSSCIITEWDHTLMPPHRLLSHDLPTAVCTCIASPEEEEEDELDRRQPQVARHQVRKLRRTRRIDPQPILVEDEDDVEGEDEGEEEEEEDAEPEEDEEGMARQRHLYETAFDCKVNRSDDDLDDLDRVTNHPVLHSQMRSSSAVLSSRTSSSTDASKQQHQQSLPYAGQSQSSKDHRRKVVLLRPKPIPSRLQQQQQQSQQQADNICTLSQDIESLQINSSDEKTGSPRLPARDYTPSPPSTAPLPAKFHGNRDHLLLNIRSAPNLPSQPDHPRLKDMRLPMKSLRAKDSPQSSEGSILEIKSRPKSFVQENSSQGRRFDKELILEFKGRPREERQRPRSLIRESRPVMEFKGRPHEAEGEVARRDAGPLEFKLRTSRRRAGYSSTESMATSSSGGSMESLRSSTSEGNRSTSSSESRHSTSLSSHSSDSGGTNCYHHHQQPSLPGFLTHHATKLHILSPISDKSSQEPASETSDNNRNNNSQKASPEESVTLENNVTAGNNTNAVTSPMDTSFKKRRAPQNKNLINLALQSSSSGDAEIQGSDSGISIESRAGIKPFGFHLLKPQLDNINFVDNEPELSDLPFDMPKLRRRRLLMQQDATTSGSATSVDLRDLPFDMPKLRKRLRCTQSTESSASQASSSLSVRDVEPPPLFGGGLARPKMTLNLDASGNAAGTEGNACSQLVPKKPGGLNLGLPLEISTARGSADLVDVELPLERQGWYHGSITRIEAEAVLRLLREGSYLVRNSESTKQDYSLSLKSARGFMHMRIQKNEELNAYILGQFSKPFESIPEMVRHFSVNRLPIRGAEHMCLLHPVIAQLL